MDWSGRTFSASASLCDTAFAFQVFYVSSFHFEMSANITPRISLDAEDNELFNQ